MAGKVNARIVAQDGEDVIADHGAQSGAKADRSSKRTIQSSVREGGYNLRSRRHASAGNRSPRQWLLRRESRVKVDGPELAGSDAA